MRNFLAQHQRRILLILLVGVLVAVGSLWWTKTINFSTLRSTSVPNPPRILVAALGRTPGAPQTLANYAAQALSSMMNATTLARTGEANVTSLLLEI
ncbi:hypothetical protein [Rhodococcus sp. IEGM 1379]|uniref:hypothetical protein n=1 Tax=Rhodococcus sp. IEGM 1379 TaxID=3047086 RepID=UPI0024B7407D|nr:hypothetical protein [Rhodococcus sp. IEGM 1379]MDI9913810.1 hypothetical protein [Rhodococcus sp. IEGM 1379]